MADQPADRCRVERRCKVTEAFSAPADTAEIKVSSDVSSSSPTTCLFTVYSSMFTQTGENFSRNVHLSRNPRGIHRFTSKSKFYMGI
ncbi:hypothetical protein Y032_0269g815 [Ancylostoma ceylanicum]|uniref:Uncharacterized protein n=1 Tax=Ancylostoma ceylanicum TaxID=53326 RepID=A0A016S8R8_9BILA|nr:hypothetical protein Y032_0269g815 [Ancylostoma ceylanicum]